MLAVLCVLALTVLTDLAVAQPAPPPDWIEVAAGNVLTLRAPLGTTFLQGHGANSFVGTFSGPGFALHMDYGAYSDPLTDSVRYGAYQTQVTRIDGKAAMIVFGARAAASSDRPYFIGLHVPDVAPSAIGPLRLTMTTTLKVRNGEAVLRRIFETIRFRPSR